MTRFRRAMRIFSTTELPGREPIRVETFYHLQPSPRESPMSSGLHHSDNLPDNQPSSVPWIWPGVLAAGRMALIDGDPGVGKSLLALDIAARLTSAQQMPDGYRPSEPANVLLLAAEDNLHDTIVPRLSAAGADLERVHAWEGDADGSPLFPEACPQLQEMIQQTSARLVIFDPLFSFLGREVASLNDLMVRRALEPLVRVAETTGAAFLP